MLMSDIWIKEQCLKADRPMISPFHSDSISQIVKNVQRGAVSGLIVDVARVTSFGLSSYGYDLSLGNKFKILRPTTDFYQGEDGRLYEHDPMVIWNDGRDNPAIVIDPCDFNPILFRDVEAKDGEEVIIPPRGFALSVVKEHLDIPDDIMGVCMEKSTIARTAIEVTVTPVEAGWAGYLTLEICNKTDYPAVLTAGMGITQLMFFKGDQPCSVPYHARNGKYQNQPAEPVIARMKD